MTFPPPLHESEEHGLLRVQARKLPTGEIAPAGQSGRRCKGED